MLTLRLANYVNGVVRIKISGVVPEKFINLCLVRGIFLWGITKHNDDVFASVRLPDFFRIRPLARASQNRISVCGYHGLPFTFKRIKRRKMLIAGAVLFFVLLNTLASYVWFVDVTGHKRLTDANIKSIARQYGLKPGVSRDGVNFKAIENEILLNLPEVAWVGINLTGTRAVIEVVEKTPPKQEDKSPANIMAVKDGVITEIIAIAGQAATKKGDTVKKGDILIKGLVVETPPAPVPGQPAIIAVPAQYIRAHGIVKARVWYESYGEAGLIREVHQRTGRQSMAVGIKAKEHEFTLKRAPAQPFDNFETEVIHKKLQGWRNSDFTVESTINIFHEVVVNSYEITPEEARDGAKGKALQTIQDLIPENAQVLARNIEILKTAEPGLVRVKVTVETVEDIGQTINITQ